MHSGGEAESGIAARPALVVGAVIRDPYDRVFVQRRSESRKLFPGCWDIVGGAVEEGEQLLDALRREIAEETGWQLERVLARIGEAEWEADGLVHREVDFLVEVLGELATPRLEWDKHPEFAWLSCVDIDLLEENESRSGSTFIKDVVTSALRWMQQTPADQRVEYHPTAQEQVQRNDHL